MKERSARIKKLAVMAMLVALSIVLVWLIHFPIFAVVPFLEYDPADIPWRPGASINSVTRAGARCWPWRAAPWP